MLAYIHGFNSCAASRTLGLLQEVFPRATGLEYPSGGHFAENLTLLQEQACALPGVAVQRSGKASSLVLVGSSLGGFYAAQLSAVLGCPCALINPVVYPHEALQPFVGPQEHFYSRERWEFTIAACSSYAHFPDPRTVVVPRLLVVGLRDDLLDPVQSLHYWQGHAMIHTTDDGHSLARLDEDLLGWLDLHLKKQDP